MTERPYGGLTPEERTADRRQRFLLAGLELFGTRGVEATYLKDVCFLSGVSPRYARESFRSVRALFDAVAMEHVAHVADLLAKPQAPDVVWLTVLDYLSEDPRRTRIVGVETLAALPDKDRARADLLRAIADAYLHWTEGSDVDDADRQISATAYAGACVELIRTWAERRVEVTPPRLATHLAHLAEKFAPVTSAGG
ncbi:hypothetical protein BH09ACT10_BH09ACT10_19020 [soil metagenome]